MRGLLAINFISTKARQRVANQHIHHAIVADVGLRENQTFGMFPYFADDARLFSQRMRLLATMISSCLRW